MPEVINILFCTHFSHFSRYSAGTSDGPPVTGGGVSADPSWEALGPQASRPPFPLAVPDDDDGGQWLTIEKQGERNGKAAQRKPITASSGGSGPRTGMEEDGDDFTPQQLKGVQVCR